MNRVDWSEYQPHGDAKQIGSNTLQYHRRKGGSEGTHVVTFGDARFAVGLVPNDNTTGRLRGMVAAECLEAIAELDAGWDPDYAAGFGVSYFRGVMLGYDIETELIDLDDGDELLVQVTYDRQSRPLVRVEAGSPKPGRYRLERV